MGVGYTHLQFLSDDAEDNEVGIALALSDVLPLNLAIVADVYYSFEAEGTFIEASLSGEYEISDWLSLAPAVIYGHNAGYIADGHDGANNIAVALEAAVAISDNAKLSGYGAYTWGINADPDNSPDDELLQDFFYGGVALTVAF